MLISEEVCWLQQKADQCANNSDDRATADLCSWKTIRMIQLSVAALNCMPRLWHSHVDDVGAASLAKTHCQSSYVKISFNLCCPAELNLNYTPTKKLKLAFWNAVIEPRFTSVSVVQWTTLAKLPEISPLHVLCRKGFLSMSDGRQDQWAHRWIEDVFAVIWMP